MAFAFDERQAAVGSARMPRERVLMAPTPERNFILILFGAVIVPADGTRAATLEKRRLRYVAAFVGQLSDKPLLASVCSCGVSKRIAQWRMEKLRADPI
jgi:hypothetical protein